MPATPVVSLALMSRAWRAPTSLRRVRTATSKYRHE